MHPHPQPAGALPFVVAVTGHRDLHPEDVAWVRQTLERTLDLIAAALPRRPVHFLSALADGADQLFAAEVIALQRRVRARGIDASRLQLMVPLPMPWRDYCVAQGGQSADAFEVRLRPYVEAAASVYTLPPRAGGDNYVGLAQHIERHADLLVAIWDGQTAPAADFPRQPGGTLDMVMRLLEASAPPQPGLSAQTGRRPASVLHIYCRRLQTSSQLLPAAAEHGHGARLLSAASESIPAQVAPQLRQRMASDTQALLGRPIDDAELALLYRIT